MTTYQRVEDALIDEQHAAIDGGCVEPELVKREALPGYVPESAVGVYRVAVTVAPRPSLHAAKATFPTYEAAKAFVTERLNDGLLYGVIEWWPSQHGVVREVWTAGVVEVAS